MKTFVLNPWPITAIATFTQTAIQTRCHRWINLETLDHDTTHFVTKTHETVSEHVRHCESCWQYLATQYGVTPETQGPGRHASAL